MRPKTRAPGSAVDALQIRMGVQGLERGLHGATKQGLERGLHGATKHTDHSSLAETCAAQTGHTALV